MRMRVVKPGFFYVDASPLARILFAGLWCVSDREGRCEDRPKRLRTEILPYDTDADVDALLDELAERGYITRYWVGGCRYIAVLCFPKHQRPSPRESPSVIPPPPMQAQAMPEHNLGAMIGDTEGEQNRRGTEGEGGHARGAMIDHPAVQAYLGAARRKAIPDAILHRNVGQIHANAIELIQGGLDENAVVAGAARLGERGGNPNLLHADVEAILRGMSDSIVAQQHRTEERLRQYERAEA